MGRAFSSCRCRSQNKREITLLMIGLDNAGKTTTTKHLLGEPVDDVVPTIGFSTVQVKQNHFDITIFDLGGGSKIRGIWKNYYALVHGIIYVVDASDVQRVDECRKEISIVLQDRRIAGKPILLLVNKQDVHGAMDEADICTSLELEIIVNEKQCPTRVETCTAVSINGKKKDKGIEKGFGWLLGHIEKHYTELKERVEQETNEQKEREAHERAERLERVRKIREERERQEMELRAADGKGDNIIQNDDDVIIGTPFKSAAKIREELKEKAIHAKEVKVSNPPDGKVIFVSSTKDESGAKVTENNQSDIGSSVSGSEYEKGITSSADMDSDTNFSHNKIAQTDEELLDGRKKVKRKPPKRFKNKVSPGCEINKPRDLPPLPHIPLSPASNSWLFNAEETNSLSNVAKSEKINWALAEELLPCEDSTELKNTQNENKWIQPELKATDSPCKR